MPLRLRLQGRPETLNDLELAAEDRFWEGLELMLSGESAGGVYLMGYAAEMWLKYACFRFERAGLTEPVRARFEPARNRHLPGRQTESWHSLLFWMEMLRIMRERAGRPLPTELDAALVLYMNVAYQNWWVNMRYFGDPVPADEAEAVHRAVTWLRDNRTKLWS